MSEQTIAVAGLRDVVRGLRGIDAQAPKQLRLVFNDAAELIVFYVRQRIEVRSGRARASVKARSTRTAARVAIGGPKAPHTPWLDFGGSVGPGGAVKRPFLREGRYVYPGLAHHRDDIIDLMQSGLVRVVRDAGLDVD